MLRRVLLAEASPDSITRRIDIAAVAPGVSVVWSTGGADIFTNGLHVRR